MHFLYQSKEFYFGNLRNTLENKLDIYKSTLNKIIKENIFFVFDQTLHITAFKGIIPNKKNIYRNEMMQY